MTNESNSLPLFVAGTKQEAGVVTSAGYECVVLDDTDELAVVYRARDERRPIVAVMNEISNEELRSFCDEAGVPCVCGSVVGGAYDLMTLADEATRTAESARAELAARRLEGMSVYTTRSVVKLLERGAVVRECVPTGLRSVDVALGGGLLEGGLVTLGAVMSTGKTTLALQVADHIARYRGRHVLFVTIEQGRAELVAKSLSRIAGEASMSGRGDTVTAASIMSARSRESWRDARRSAFEAACAVYDEHIAPHMWMMEAEKQPTVAEVEQAARAVMGVAGRAPVVIVDYLQLLAPAQERMTEKQAVDNNVMALRHLARDLKTCVVVISSLNRASYSGGVTIDSFKESGAVEYGSDVLLGLQPRGMDDDLANVGEGKRRAEANRLMETHKSSPVREVELKVLKNRHWALPPQPVPLVFDAAASLFLEDKSPSRPTPRKVK